MQTKVRFFIDMYERLFYNIEKRTYILFGGIINDFKNNLG